MWLQPISAALLVAAFAVYIWFQRSQKGDAKQHLWLTLPLVVVSFAFILADAIMVNPSQISGMGKLVRAVSFPFAVILAGLITVFTVSSSEGRTEGYVAVFAGLLFAVLSIALSLD